MLLLSSKEIQDYYKDISTEPFRGKDGLYHMIYLTTNSINEKIYLGVHSTIKIKDGYIGNGIQHQSDAISIRKLNNTKKRIAFVDAVLKHHYKNFIRHDVLFLKNREELIKIEIELVNKTFVNHPLTYNIALGGGHPPRLPGELNGNYENTWSYEQKKIHSEKAIDRIYKNLSEEERQLIKESKIGILLKPKTNRIYKIEYYKKLVGENNPNARYFYLYDFIENKFLKFYTLEKLAQYTGIKYSTLSSYINIKNFTHKRYLVISEMNFIMIKQIQTYLEECKKSCHFFEKKNYKEHFHNTYNNINFQKLQQEYEILINNIKNEGN